MSLLSALRIVDSDSVVEANRIFHRHQAAVYDETHDLPLIEQALLESLISPSDDVVDIGAGTGAIASCLNRDDIVSVDLSKAMLSAGFGPRLQASASQLPLQSDSADVIAARSVLHHVPDVSEVLSEISRILRPGGQFIAIHEPVGEPRLISTYRRVRDYVNRVRGNRMDEWLERAAKEAGVHCPQDLIRLANVHARHGIEIGQLDAEFDCEDYFTYSTGRYEHFAYVGIARSR